VWQPFWVRAVVVSVAFGLCLAACGGRSRVDIGPLARGGGPGTAGSDSRPTGGFAGESGGTTSAGGSLRGGTGGAAGVGGNAAEAGSGGSGGRPSLPEAECTKDGFCQSSPEVTANDLRGVWGSGPNDVGAVGDGGTIVHYDGSSWQRVGSGTVARMLGVSGTSADDVWFVGENGTVIHYDGFGLNPAAGPRASVHLTAVHAIAPDDAWIASGSLIFPVPDDDWGVVYHFDGTTWRDLRPESTRSIHRALWAASHNDVWLTGDNTYHFDGDSWSRVAATSGDDIWGSSELGVWTTDLSNVSYFDGTSSTTSLDENSNQSLFGVWGTSERDLFAVGGRGYIAHNDGTGWSTMSSGTTRSLFAIWGSSPSDVWAVGQSGTILHYDGARWSSSIPDRRPETVRDLSAIWGATDDEQWIASSAGILAYDGDSRTRASGPATDDMQSYYSIWGTARDNVVAVGSSGAIAEFDGQVWSRVPDSPTPESLVAVWGHSEKMLAVGGRIGIVRAGTGSWQLEPVTGGAGGSRSAIWGSSEDDIWVTSYISGVLGHYVGGRWEVESTSVFVRALWGTAADDIWGVGARQVSHYDGSLWTSESLAEDGPVLTAVGGCSSADIWAVGDAGAIVHYDGSRWSSLDSGTTNSLHGVRCSPGGVWVVGEGGIVLKNTSFR